MARVASSDGIAFRWGAAGGTTLFSVTLAFLVAYYHKRWAAGMLVVLCALMVTVAVHLLWFARLPGSAGLLRSVIPSISSSLFVYFGLHWFHLRLSRTHVDTYLRQLTSDASEALQDTWTKRSVWIMFLIGALVVTGMILAARG